MCEGLGGGGAGGEGGGVPFHGATKCGRVGRERPDKEIWSLDVCMCGKRSEFNTSN